MSFDAAAFLKDMGEQCALYEKMIEATREQNRLIESSEVDKLLAVLKNKNMLLTSVGEIEERTKGARDTWNEVRDSIDPGLVKKVEQAVTKTKAVLQELLKLEEEGKAMMEKQKSTTTDKLKNLQQKKKALNAYGQKTKKDPKFYDKNS